MTKTEDAVETLYRARLHAWRVRTDRLFAWLLSLQWVAGVILAATYSPTAWDGRADSVHPHVWAAVFLGGLVTFVPVGLALKRPGALETRHAIAAGQMLTSALLIHLSAGRIETHFHVFGSLAFLAFYRDPWVLVTATLVVTVDHTARGLFWPESVYGVAFATIWRTLEHAFWVVFEDVVLVLGCLASQREMREIALQQVDLEASQSLLANKLQLERELEIASKIQTSVLPRNLTVAGLEIAGRMIPASEVGGDYYEVLPVRGGCWLGIGDVSGHGLTSGLVMLMMQSSLASLARQRPDAAPRELLCILNEVLYENLRKRIDDDNHATLSLLRYHDDGRLVFAGAHEDIIVSRANGSGCDIHPTPGPWVGVVGSVERMAVDTTRQLEPGDVMLLYTDGVTEARSAEGELFGLDRLVAALETIRNAPVGEIRDHLTSVVQAWTAQQEDDITLLVVRRSAALALPA